MACSGGGDFISVLGAVAAGAPESPSATVYGCGKCRGDATCAAPGYRLATRDSWRGRVRDEVGGQNCCDPLEDDARVSRADRGSEVQIAGAQCELDTAILLAFERALVA